jgi:tmRNA-binding protein
MNILSRVLFVIILTLTVLLVIGYWYLHLLEGQLSHIKTELALAKATIQYDKERLEIEQRNCKAELQLVRKLVRTEESTVKEIQTKVKKGTDYEILATDRCGCKFDGTGWVFK